MGICASCDTDTCSSHCHDRNNGHISYKVTDYSGNEGYQRYYLEPTETIIIRPETTVEEYNSTPPQSCDYGFGSPNPPPYNPQHIK